MLKTEQKFSVFRLFFFGKGWRVMPLRFLSLPLEMLVVFHPAPVAAPAESV